MKKILPLGLAIIIVGSVSGYFALTMLSEKRPQKPMCRTVEIKRGAIRSSVFGTGTVKPKQLFHIKAKRSGKIAAIMVKKEETVAEKQRLIRVKPEPGFAVEIENLHYNLYTAELQKKIVEENLNKQRKLFDRGLVAQAVIEELERNLTKAEKERSLALDRLKVLEEETGQSLSSSTNETTPSTSVDIFILAPSSGTVVEINKQVGDVITADRAQVYNPIETNVIVLADLTTLYVECKVNEIDIKSVRVGQSAMVRLEAQPEKVYSGKIEKVSAMAAPWMQSSNLMDGGLNYFTTVVKIEDPDKMVRPGMTCNVQIVVKEKKEVLLLPVETVVSSTNQGFVIYETHDEFEKKAITTGISDEHNVEIVSGLSENASVCDHPLILLEWQEQIHRYDQRNFVERLLQ